MKAKIDHPIFEPATAHSAPSVLFRFFELVLLISSNAIVGEIEEPEEEVVAVDEEK